MFSSDGSTVSVVYRVTIKGSDGEVAWTHHSSFFFAPKDSLSPNFCTLTLTLINHEIHLYPMHVCTFGGGFFSSLSVLFIPCEKLTVHSG